MIIQKAKPVFYAHCDMCGAENRLEIDYNHALLPDTQATDQADSHGFSCVHIQVETAGKRLRGQYDLLVCPVCLRTLVSVLRTPSDQLWAQLSRFMPEEIKGRLDDPISEFKLVANEPVFESVRIYAGMNGASRPPEVHTTHMPKSTIGLPATTVAKLQSVAMEQGSHGPEEQAALRRLLSQEGTIEDIGLLREIANLAKVNLPLEAQLRDIDSVHEELRRNA